ncbi:MAG: DUF3866 family protein [Actinomycetaceae bacterium]|nr:DUF3866 family protein [Actinomycetaceae bacterium]
MPPPYRYASIVLQRKAQIIAIQSRWSSAVTFSARIIETPAREIAGFGVGTKVKALAYTDLVGPVAQGDIVRIDCTPLAKQLGTGGYAMTLSTETLPDDWLSSGHIMKARYTPYQQMVLSTEEEASPHRDIMAKAHSLDQIPVVIADLHSAVPAVVAALRALNPRWRIVYVMDDTAALPIVFSRAVAQMRHDGELAATVTSGQSYGGDLEAASIPSALLSAYHVARADCIIVAQGPGNLGTGTTFGFSGTAVSHVIHSAHSLGGTPLPVVRASQADTREEHRGISHHSLTTLLTLTLVGTRIGLVDIDSSHTPSDVVSAYRYGASLLAAHHDISWYDSDLCRNLLAHSQVRLSTMGRSFEEDELAFTTAAAAALEAQAVMVARAAKPARDGRHAMRPLGAMPPKP